MPFGKFRNKPLTEIPLSYLKWVYENCSNATPALRNEIRQLIDEDSPSEPNQHPLAPALIGQWYRQLSLQFHPDRSGGSHEAMKAINRAHEVLLEMTERPR